MVINIEGSNIEIIKNPHEFKTYSEVIKVKGEVPADALVTLEISNIPWEYSLRLKPTEKNVFETRFILPESVITFLKESNSKVYNFKVKVDGLNVRGKIPFTINFKSLLANGKTIIENDYKKLLQEYNRLNLKLDTYIKKNYVNGVTPAEIEGLKPGMVPIAMDSVGNFRYDYLFPKYDSILNDIVSLNQKQSDLIVSLTERVGKLEEDLIDLKYKPIL